MDLLQDAEQMRQHGLEAFKGSAERKNQETLEAQRIRYLGTKGLVKHYMQRLKEVQLDQRPIVGKRLNEIRDEL